jgi:hypothetical protein
MKKILFLVLAMVIMVSVMTGCERQSDIASYNLSLEADSFNIVRQLTFINCVTNETLFQMTAKMSIETDAVNRQLEVTVEDEKGTYQKHFFYLADNVTYIVEQKRFKNVDAYNYTLNFNPKLWLPVQVKTVD